MRIKLSTNIMIVLLLFVITFSLGFTGFTYSFFEATIIGAGKQNVIVSGDVYLNFNDDTMISTSGLFPGDSMEKIFSVQNNSGKFLYYKIGWESITNTFLNDEIHIELECTQYINYGELNQEESGTCQNMEQTPVGTVVDPIMDGIYIENGMTQEYTVTITFIKLSINQNYNKGKTFNGTLNIIGSVDQNPIWYENCDSNNTIKCKILTDNTPKVDAYTTYNVIANNATLSGLFYNYYDSFTEDVSNDGLGDRTYYFRGVVSNNYIAFGGFCWRVVRINEDGSVRMRYHGLYSESSCTQTSVMGINNAGYKFNNSTNNRNIGYKMGETCTTYATCHQNDLDSNAKIEIEKWYDVYLKNYDYFIADEVYCNDRTLKTGTGIGTTATSYAASGRLTTPTFKCNNDNDKFTKLSLNGNAQNVERIGLLTMDEYLYAGFSTTTANTSGYLHTGYIQWSMSPSNVTTSSALLYTLSAAGKLAAQATTTNGYLYPVISLKSNTPYVSGLGSYTSPYLVQ